MHTLICYYCLFCPISILLRTLNSTFFNFKSVVHYLKFVPYLLLSRPFGKVRRVSRANSPTSRIGVVVNKMM